MKKTYVKPELYFESFELSQSIADCGWELQSMDDKTCHAISDPDKLGLPFNLFQQGVANCQMDSRSFYCYQPGVQDSYMMLHKS